MPSEIEAYFAKLLPKLRAELLAEMGGFLVAKNAELSPVGTPPMDPHPGKLAASWRGSVGEPVGANLGDAPSYPPPSGNRMEFVVPLRGSRPGQEIHVTNDARDAAGDPYSYEIAVSGASPKAPAGTVEPSLQGLEAEWSEVAETAMARAAGEAG